MLAEQLPHRHENARSHPVIRRLTRAEWKHFKSSGIIPYEGAVALLVVPPSNRNPVTKERPTPSTSSSPVQSEDSGPANASSLPTSVLHPAAPATLCKEGDTHESDLLPQAMIPLYNSVTLFRLRTQRAALHFALNQLLRIERRARSRHQQHPASKGQNEPQNPVEGSAKQDSVKTAKGPARGDDKGSHAYLLYSNGESVLRADTAPLAIALWRLRLWEGEGWSDYQNTDGIYHNPLLEKP